MAAEAPANGLGGAQARQGVRLDAAGETFGEARHAVADRRQRRDAVSLPERCARVLGQRQSRARATSRARTGSSAPEASAAARCVSSVTTAPNRPCRKWPVRGVAPGWSPHGAGARARARGAARRRHAGTSTGCTWFGLRHQARMATPAARQACGFGLLDAAARRQAELGASGEECWL